MSQITDPATGSTWTAADLCDRFGPIPLRRILSDPPPGQATEEDLVRIHDREGRLCELVDGVLVEKTVGWYESFLAAALIQYVRSFVEANDLGIVLGADGMMRLWPGLIRLPDAAFVSWQRVRGLMDPRQPVLPLGPDLAIEVISRGNTRQEMERKLAEYFEAGARQVWYFYPEERTVRVYTAADRFTTLTEEDTLDGGDLLPGFRLNLKEFFAPPSPRGEK